MTSLAPNDNNQSMDLRGNYRKSTSAYFSILLNKLMKRFDQALFERADKASSNQEQNRYFECMQEFRSKSPAMLVCYNEFISKGLGDFFAASTETINGFNRLADELSLIGKEELENELAINIITSRANTQYAEQLWKLNRRLAVLRGGKKVEDESNPCGPAHLCHALQSAANLLDVDVKTKIVLYQMFEKRVLPKAGEFYDKMNIHFADSRILPNLQFQVEKGSHAKPQKQQAQGKPTEGVKGGQKDQAPGQKGTTYQWLNPQEEQRQQELISAIRSLQHVVHPGGGRKLTAGGVDYGPIGTDGSGGADTFRETDYAFALSAIQQKMQLPQGDKVHQAKTVEYVENHFIQQLDKLSAGKERNKITEQDADTIDLVGLLFRYVLDDPKLPDSLKTLISHLHTPLLKVALIDKDFFSQSAHPARRLLNLMTEIGSQWISEEGTDRLVFPKLKGVVSRILQDFVDDLEIFDELLAELNAFAKILQERSELAVKRNTEAEKGLERLAKARLRAAEEIVDRLEGHDIPQRTLDLLEEPWTDFLAFNFLRHGDQSLTWESALKVVDGVVWSVQPEFKPDEIDKFRALQEKLDESIRHGLETIGYDPETSKELLADLKCAQELALKDVAQGIASVESEAVESETVESETVESAGSPYKENFSSNEQVAEADYTEETPVSDAEARPRKKEKTSAIERQIAREKAKLKGMDQETLDIFKKLEKIEFGTMFEFQPEVGGKTVSLKLAWYSCISDHYMFVNKAGMKSEVKTQKELAKGLGNGSISIVEQRMTSFMERALESIMGKLKAG